MAANFKKTAVSNRHISLNRTHAQGHTLQLVNHVDTLADWPWATSLNLQRAIAHMAQLMDKDEDVFLLRMVLKMAIWRRNSGR